MVAEFVAERAANLVTAETGQANVDYGEQRLFEARLSDRFLARSCFPCVVSGVAESQAEQMP
jgi:hypothetical protein